jgi:thioredoxin-dependent peroxiredoxin
MLPVGSQAPDFTARLDDGSEFRLSAVRGDKHVVLYFYPKDGTAGCTAEACAFRDNYAAIGAFDAIILGVSVDSEDSHRSFKEHNALGFPLISDPDGRLYALYDVKSVLPLIRPRVTYVIDKQAVIRAAFRHDLAIGRHLKDTLETLEALQADAAMRPSTSPSKPA